MPPHCKTADHCGDKVFPPHGNCPDTGWTTTTALHEYVNHGGKLFKVYVLLGELVCIFSRESLPNLSLGEEMQQINNDPRKQLRTTAEGYVEFERPAGSRC